MIMAMKESGIEWVGLIPDTWSVIPNKYVMHKEKNLCKKWTGEEVMSLTMNGVIVRDLQNPTGKMPATFDGYQYIEDGDLLMCLFDIDVTPRCVGKVTYDGVTSPAYSNFKVHDNASRDYFYYYYLMVDNTKELLHLAKNLRHSFTEEQLGQLKVPMPPLSEQKVIADYLDETCSQIDEIIAEAKKSIDEYKELKQSVIFEAVTKGLDKDVEMKNSEVEGMGFIPKKWSVVRFMKVNYVRARLGWKGLKAEEYVDVGYPFLAAYHIVNNHLCWESLNCITKERYDESPEIKLSIGDLVLVKDGAGIGKCARIDEMPLGEATVNSSLSVITPNKLLDYRYEYYYFMSPLFQNIIARLKNGMGVPHLTQESMKDIYLPLPSKKEQQAIADYLDNKVVELDTLIAEKESLINDLEAYKKSLIYEVVTGKRRVV